MGQWEKAVLEAVILERERLYHSSWFEKYRVVKHVRV